MNQEKIGKFILELRTERKMTQQELASKLSITDKAVSKWENGRCMPDLELIKPLCEILGVTINELLSGEKLTEENYQQKLEENMLQINSANFKSNVLKGVKLFLFLVILVPFFIITFILGYTIVQEYKYTHVGVSSSEVNLKMCETKTMVWFNFSRKNGKPISVDSELNLESKSLTFETFHYRSSRAYEGYAKDVNVGYKKSEYDKIYYDGKLVWNKEVILQKCE